MTGLSTKTKVAFRIGMGLYLSLALTLISLLWQSGAGLKWLLVLLVPLLLPLAGLIKQQPRSSAWLCFILCFYFIGGVLKAWANPWLWSGWLITGLSLALFITAMLFTRWQGKRSMAAACPS